MEQLLIIWEDCMHFQVGEWHTTLFGAHCDASHRKYMHLKSIVGEVWHDSLGKEADGGKSFKPNNLKKSSLNQIIWLQRQYSSSWVLRMKTSWLQRQGNHCNECCSWGNLWYFVSNILHVGPLCSEQGSCSKQSFHTQQHLLLNGSSCTQFNEVLEEISLTLNSPRRPKEFQKQRPLSRNQGKQLLLERPKVGANKSWSALEAVSMQFDLEGWGPSHFSPIEATWTMKFQSFGTQGISLEKRRH